MSHNTCTMAPASVLSLQKWRMTIFSDISCRLSKLLLPFRGYTPGSLLHDNRLGLEMTIASYCYDLARDFLRPQEYNFFVKFLGTTNVANTALSSTLPQTLSSIGMMSIIWWGLSLRDVQLYHVTAVPFTRAAQRQNLAVLQWIEAIELLGRSLLAKDYWFLGVNWPKWHR